MQEQEIDASSGAPVRLPWEEIGSEALVRCGSLGVPGAVDGGKIRKVRPENRADMHGQANDASIEAPARLPWEEIALEALVWDGALGVAGAVYGGKIRKVRPENRAEMHGQVNGLSSDAPARLQWEEFSFECLSACVPIFPRLLQLFCFALLGGGMRWSSQSSKAQDIGGIRSHRALFASQSEFPPKTSFTR